ncbi:MAG: class I SAM-dependent methyltransferase [Casimicrobiaceae bacterium]
MAPRAATDEIAWYEASLPREAGILLHLSVGHGRLLIPLLEAGLSLHGVDTSAACLGRCGERLDEAGRRAELFRQDATALNLPFRYAAAFFAAGTFQRLTSRVRALDALLRIRAHMIGPGLLLLDLVVPEEAAHPPGAPIVELRTLALPDGSQIARRSETVVDPVARRSVVHNRFERRRGAKVTAREDDVCELTWYAEEEIVAIVRDAGYGGIRCEPLPWRQAPNDRPARHFAVTARV